MTEKLYKISAPIGTEVLPKEKLAEKELREFATQLIKEPSEREIWAEKFQKDEIESVVEWLIQAGYKIEAV